MSDKTVLVNFFPTSRCDVGCRHCISDANMCNPIDLPISYISLLNKQLDSHDYYVTYCATGNGEPLCHPEFNKLLDEIFSYSRAKGMTLLTSAYTKNEILKRERFNTLLRSNYLRRIQALVSFNLYADFHDRWMAILEDVIKSERKFNLLASICHSYENQGETLEAFTQTLRKYALTSEVRTNFLHLVSQPNNSFVDRPMQIIDEKTMKHMNGLQIATEKPLFYLFENEDVKFIGAIRAHTIKEGRGSKLHETSSGVDCCRDFFRDFDVFLHLDPDGYWYPNLVCPKNSEMRLGHIETDDIDVILRRKYMFWTFMTRLLLLDERTYDAKKPCKVCTAICREFSMMEWVTAEVK